MFNSDHTAVIQAAKEKLERRNSMEAVAIYPLPLTSDNFLTRYGIGPDPIRIDLVEVEVAGWRISCAIHGNTFYFKPPVKIDPDTLMPLERQLQEVERSILRTGPDLERAQNEVVRQQERLAGLQALLQTLCPHENSYLEFGIKRCKRCGKYLGVFE